MVRPSPPVVKLDLSGTDKREFGPGHFGGGRKLARVTRVTVV